MRRGLAFLLMAALLLGCGAVAQESGVWHNEEAYGFEIMGNLVPELKEGDAAFLAKLEQTLNLEITMTLPASSSYVETLQMMFASGTYPELVLIDAVTNPMYKSAAEDGVVLPLEGYLADTPSLMAYSYEVSWEALKLLGDERIFGVPRTSISRADGMCIRKDWLDALGIEFEDGPITLDELTEIVRAFTFDDPDKNGIADTYGMGASSTDGKLAPLVKFAFGLNGWLEYDGEYMDLMYSREHDNFKQALAYSNMLWEEGLVDPDWPTVNGAVALERFEKGITGFGYIFSGWLQTYENIGKELNPNYELGYVTMVVADEDAVPMGGVSGNGTWGCWAITESCGQPARVMQMLDYMLSDDGWTDTIYGVEGVDWVRDDNDAPVPTDKYTGQTVGRAMVRRSTDPSFFITLDTDAETRARLAGLIQACIDQSVFTLDKGYRPPIKDDPAFIEYEADMQVQISRIIVGELEIDAWDGILEGWYAAGGETYMQQMRDYIASQNA